MLHAKSIVQVARLATSKPICKIWRTDSVIRNTSFATRSCSLIACNNSSLYINSLRTNSAVARFERFYSNENTTEAVPSKKSFLLISFPQKNLQ